MSFLISGQIRLSSSIAGLRRTRVKLSRFVWVAMVVLLVAIIAGGSFVAWSRYSPGRAIEISLPPEKERRGEIYVGGEVNNPGIYPLEAGDSVGDVIKAAGGATENADPDRLRLYIPGAAGEELPQKVDINRADAWLLEALPGIGEARAQAIIDYRQKNGLFHRTDELLKVAGMGEAIYEKIKDLITVGD
jgi:competence protein ComEA